MPVSTYGRLRLVDASTPISHLSFEAEDAARLAGAASADDLVDQFVSAKSWRGLAQALTFMLPPRETVWTACLWARACENAKVSAPSRALRAAEVWVRDQVEDVRYKGFELANEEKMASVGSWAALAAFWSGPTLSQPEFEPVPPRPELAAIAASAAYTLAAVALAHREGAEKDLTELALEVALGESGLARLAALFGSGENLAARS